MRIIRFWSIVMALCLTVLLVSTSSSYASSSNAAATPRETVIQAYQNLANQKNYHMTFGSQSSLSVQGRAVNVFTKGEFDVQSKPMLCRNIMNITIEAPSKKIEQTIVQYVEESENQLTIYSYANNQWLKQSLPYYNPLNEYDNYFKAITSVTPVSEDADSAVFEVIVNGSYLKENIANVMTMTGMEKLKLPEDLLNNLGDFKYMVTVDKKAALVSKIDIDLSGLMSIIGNGIANAREIPDDQKNIIREMFNNLKVTTAISFSPNNNQEKIIIPAAAKNAVANTTMQFNLPPNLSQS